MKTKSLRPLFLALLLLALPVFAAAEGATAPASPTDLGCTHEHTKETIYFYDSPAYTPVSAEQHRVSGTATVETVCLDCGEVVNVETNTYAQQLRPHTFKNDVCALCGFRRDPQSVLPAMADENGERTVFAVEQEESGLLTLTLTDAEMSGMESDQVTTLVVRDEAGSAAIAMDVAEVRAAMKTAGADLYMELLEREDDSFFAGLHLVPAGEEEMRDPACEGITLRFYRAESPALKVSLSPVDSDVLVEAQSEWDENGYWSVPYLEEGTYFLRGESKE